MTWLWWLILGAVIGFVLEWLVDWQYWRRPIDAKVAQPPIDTQTREQLTAAQARITELENQLQASLTRAPQMVVERVVQDRLQDIKGIGNVFAGRLNEAGIYTFGELAATSPSHLHNIINPEEWQAIDPTSWIEQAKTLAQKKQA